MLDRLSFKREKIVDIQKALKTADVNQDNKLDFEEWRANLKSYVSSIKMRLFETLFKGYEQKLVISSIF